MDAPRSTYRVAKGILVWAIVQYDPVGIESRCKNKSNSQGPTMIWHVSCRHTVKLFMITMLVMVMGT